ncbi:MAG TPA: hypothetical protein HA222_03700 [Candidatus Diapherotrites archaeon]|uniref:Uncharacterized protein n=1 Tax=Candidatus Iainarchaeum sp. TaxID=3101447 RepID=A0A7J4JVD0_9ARCH|nr:hypothetical protein [Candidatus Diapherotrites archaeon]
MSKKIIPLLLVLILIAGFAVAKSAQVDSGLKDLLDFLNLGQTAPPEPTDLAKPAIIKINDNEPGSNPKVIIATDSLKVDFSYGQGDNYAALEIWALTDSEKTAFENGTFDKASNKALQFVLGRPYAKEAIALKTAVDKKAENDSEKTAWGGLNVLDYYNYVKKLSDSTNRKFYLAVESSKDASNPWKYSPPYQIQFATEVQTAGCETILKCLSLISERIVQQLVNIGQ